MFLAGMALFLYIFNVLTILADKSMRYLNLERKIF